MFKKKQKIAEIVPELGNEQYVQFAIVDEIIDLVISLAGNPRAVKPNANSELRNYVGERMVAPEILKLASTVALFRQKLSNGNNKKTLRNYLNYRVSVVTFYTGYWGRQVLDAVRVAVQKDIDGFPNRQLPRQPINNK